MFFYIVLLYITLLILSIMYLPPAYSILTALLIIYWIDQYLLYMISYSYQDKNIPRYSSEQMIQLLQHGDIINSTPYLRQQNKNKYFNYMFAHVSIVIEEDNKKYVVESYHDYKTSNFIPPSRIIKKGVFNKNQNWYVVKVPLEEFFLLDRTQCYCIYRHPNPKLIKYDPSMIKLPEEGGRYYCTLTVSDILLENNIINKSMQIYPYRTTELLDALASKGYKNFYCVH